MSVSVCVSVCVFVSYVTTALCRLSPRVWSGAASCQKDEASGWATNWVEICQGTTNLCAGKEILKLRSC